MILVSIGFIVNLEVFEGRGHGVFLVHDPNRKPAATVGDESPAHQSPVYVGFLEGVGCVYTGESSAVPDEVVESPLLGGVGEIAAGTVEQHEVVVRNIRGPESVNLEREIEDEVARLLQQWSEDVVEAGPVV